MGGRGTGFVNCASVAGVPGATQADVRLTLARVVSRICTLPSASATAASSSVSCADAAPWASARSAAHSRRKKRRALSLNSRLPTLPHSDVGTVRAGCWTSASKSRSSKHRHDAAGACADSTSPAGPTPTLASGAASSPYAARANVIWLRMLAEGLVADSHVRLNGAAAWLTRAVRAIAHGAGSAEAVAGGVTFVGWARVCSLAYPPGSQATSCRALPPCTCAHTLRRRFAARLGRTRAASAASSFRAPRHRTTRLRGCLRRARAGHFRHGVAFARIVRLEILGVYRAEGRAHPSHG